MNYNFGQKTIIDKEIKVINSFDLELQTDYNSWSVIFECNDISCKLIRTPLEYTGFLVRYSTGAETGLHYNDSEYEILKVKDGEIINLETNEHYKKGDTLIINKNEKHNIKALSESYIFCIMTKHKSVVEKLIK
jgi:quercetin dioxygenase-like cupin family protein